MLAMVGALLAAVPAPAPANTAHVAVSLPTWQSTYDWPAGDGAFGWDALTETADPGAYAFGNAVADRPGLWLWLTGGREYRPGSAEWRLRAPGTTRIASVDLRLAYADKLYAHHCVDAGIRASSPRDAVLACSPPDAPATAERYDVHLEDPDAAPASTEAYVRVEMPVCHNPAPTPCSKWIPVLDPFKNGPFVRVLRADLVLVDDDQPTVDASGPLRDLADGYTDGRTTYDLTLTGHDPGAGVARTALVRDGAGEVTAADAPCDPAHRTAALGSAVCPADAPLALRVDTNPFPEGAISVHPTVRDLAQNEGAGAPWRFFVDRTAPPAPYDFDVFVDDSDDEAIISWLGEDDPALADGNPGSGLQGWEYRFSHAGGPWSEWRIGTQSLQVPDSYEGDEIAVEARSVDAVGNRSATVTDTMTIPPFDDADDWDPDIPADDEPITYGMRRLAHGSLHRAAVDTFTLTFSTSTQRARRDAALAAADEACNRAKPRSGCVDAVKYACKSAGACKPAKEIACRNVVLYCAATASSAFDYNGAAHRLRPRLFFDTDEKFRPLNVDTFFRETPLEICDQRVSDDTCEPLNGHPERFSERRFRHPKALMNQIGARVGDQEDRHHTTVDECVHDRLKDCDDSTTENATYWQIARPSGPRPQYFYINYWFFYRYNGAPISVDEFEHEGDWEGITLAVNYANPRVFHYAAFDQHGHLWRYLRDALRCGADHTTRCGGSAQRVNAYVADGTHATYPRRCSATVIKCRQTDSDGTQTRPDGGHDGEHEWGLDNVYEGLKPLPDPDGSSWVDWAGNWNENWDNEIRSPAWRDPGKSNWERYSAPWGHQRCTTRDSDHTCPRVRTLSAMSVHETAPDADCGSWVGEGVAAAVCDPVRLSRAIEEGAVDGADALKVSASGLPDAEGNGIVQVVGDDLDPGRTLRLTGVAGSQTVALVRVGAGADARVLRLTDLGLEHGGTAKVTTSAAGDVVTARLVRPDGTAVSVADVVPRGKAGSARAGRRPHRPSVSGIRRHGRSVTALVGSGSQRVLVQLARGCAGDARAARVVALRGSHRVRARVDGWRAGMRFRVIAVGARGQRSTTVCRVVR